MPRTEGHPEPTWVDSLNDLRVYLAEHDGRFPAPNSKDPYVASLAGWWLAQRSSANYERLSANRRAAVDDTARLARELRTEAKAAAFARATENLNRYQRRVALAAARQQIRQAQKMLDSPHLVPGDREILQLRVEHPRATLAELAEMAGKTRSAYAAKLRGALGRHENSSFPGGTPVARGPVRASRADGAP